MSKRNIVVGLDVGTSWTKAAVGEINHLNNVQVLGLVQVPSSGLRKGNIIDIESTAKAIEACLNELEQLTGVEIISAQAGFSSVSISAVNNHAVIAASNPDNAIRLEDRDRALQSARSVSIPPDKTVLQVIERQYIIDGFDGVKDPVGMIGSRLEAEVIVITAAIAGIQNLHRSAQRINLNIDQLAYNQLLAAEAVLMPAEREMGVALIDMGGGITEVSVFSQGSILGTAVLPIGSDFITKDLAIVLRTSIEEAIRIKEEYGVASPDMARDDVVINLRNVQGNDLREVDQRLVAEIIYARVQEMIEMINNELQQFAFLDKLTGGIVFTGGGSQLAGITEIMEEYWNIPVRRGKPDNIIGLRDEINKPQNSVALGGLIYGLKNLQPIVLESKSGVSNVFNKINNWLKDLFA